MQVGIDAWNWRLSSSSVYAGAIVGGAAGGVAATLCGTCATIVAGSVSGAVGGGVGNLVTGGLSGSLSLGAVTTDAAVGAIGGAVVGHLAPAAFKSFVPNSVKGDIGEALSATGLFLSGETDFLRNQLNGIGRSIFGFPPVDSWSQSLVQDSCPHSRKRRPSCGVVSLESIIGIIPQFQGLSGVVLAQQRQARSEVRSISSRQ